MTTTGRFLGWMKRLSRTALVLGAAVVASAATVRAEDVTIGAGLSMGWGQFFVADQAKTWDKQGLTPKTTIFASGRLALDALVGGGVVVATAAETPVLFANLNGLPVRIIATLNRQESFDLVAIKDIKAAKDIKGHKIGYSQGTNAHYYLSKLLKEANLTFADITAVSLNPGDFVTSLSNGAIDAFIWTEPHISLALKQGGNKFHAIRSPGLYVGFSTVIALQSTIDKNPELLVKVVKSLIDANDLIKKDPNAAAALIAERIKVDPEIVRNFLPRTRFDIDLERADLVAELQTQAKWAIDNKLVRPDAKVPDFNTVVVGSILDKARAN